MSQRRFRLETIKVTLIVVFHTPSCSLWKAFVRLNFLNAHLRSADEKAPSPCVKHKTNKATKNTQRPQRTLHRGCRREALLACIYEHWVKGFCMRALHDWTLWYGNTGRQPLSKTRLALDPASTQPLAPTHFSGSRNGFLFSAGFVAFAELEWIYPFLMHCDIVYCTYHNS